MLHWTSRPTPSATPSTHRTLSTTIWSAPQTTLGWPTETPARLNILLSIKVMNKMHGCRQGKVPSTNDRIRVGPTDRKCNTCRLSFDWKDLFIHSDHFYSASSSPLLLRGAPDTARILCRNFAPKRHRQLWVKDLPMVLTWRLQRESNSWPFGRKTSSQPMRHTQKM